MTTPDALGSIVVELTAGLQPSGDGGSVVTVRGGDRYTGTNETPSEPPVSGDRPPLVRVVRLSRRRVGLHRTVNRIAAISYGNDPEHASAINLRVGDLLQLAGPRLRSNGVAIYNSKEEIGGQPGQDPVTGWSTETSIYIVHAAAQAVASAS